jgi:HK97 family phage prohead protease
MNERNSLHADVEWKAGGGAGELEGYASVFGNVDQVGDVVMPGAFRKTISDWRRASQPMPLIADHDTSTNGLIGSVTDMHEDRNGLRFKARLSRSDKAQRIRQDILDGHLRGTSFTYEVIKETRGHGSIGGKAVGRFLDELRLYEITLSPFPVNELAGVTAAKAVVSGAWDGSPSRFTDEQYQRSCLIDRGGDAPVKQRCSLPIREPSGAINRNALGAAAAVLAGGRGGVANVSPELRRRAARALIRAYGEADMEPPDSLRRLAGAGSSSLGPWLESMQHAVAISDPFARKAALDELVRGYPNDTDTDLAADVGDAPVTANDAATDPGDTSTPDDAYAVSFLNGPPDGAPTGQPPDPALPGPLAGLEQQRSIAEIDALEADIRAALEG